MAPWHELDPLYVPLMDDADAVPLPEADAVQAANGLSNPPAGTVKEN